jgi:hypothetical protein
MKAFGGFREMIPPFYTRKELTQVHLGKCTRFNPGLRMIYYLDKMFDTVTQQVFPLPVLVFI